MKKIYFLLLILLFSFVLADTNPYSDATLEDINMSINQFYGYPLKVNIKKYWNGSNYVDRPSWLFDANYFKQAKYFLIEFTEINKKILLPASRILLSTNNTTVSSTSGLNWITADCDLVLDMPEYYKDYINFGYITNVFIKPLNDNVKDINNKFSLKTGIFYDKGQTLWILYNTKNITNENQFLPRKVLVNLWDWSKLIKSQVIDVFKEGKLEIKLPSGVSVTNITKTNFYVIGETTEKNFWYANGPIIKNISCPSKISTPTDCTIDYLALDSWQIKLYVKSKRLKDTYQVFTFDVTGDGKEHTETFNIDPNLWYPDGEYVVHAYTFKNGIQQQYVKTEFIIDRFKPTFAEALPIILIPDNAVWSYIANIMTSERLKAQPIGLKCDSSYVIDIQQDNVNPYLYHITLNLSNISSKQLTAVKCNLTDVGLNKNIAYFYVKFYKTSGNWLWFNNVNWILDWINLNFDILKDRTVLANFNTIGDWTIKITTSDNKLPNTAFAIETYRNTDLEIQKTILLANGKNVYKIYPDTKQFISLPKNIISITYDWIGNYWYVTDDGSYYKNTTFLGNIPNLIYYNLFRWSYIIYYIKDDWLYIDWKKIKWFDETLVAFDIIKSIDNDHILAIWFDKNNIFKWYYIDLLNKNYQLSFEKQRNNTYNIVNGDFAYYQNKIIFIGKASDVSTSIITILPLPEIKLINKDSGNEIVYIASPTIKFDKVLYQWLNIIPLVKWKMFPTVDDCWSGNDILFNWQTIHFDTNPWCNIKELNLKHETDENKIEPLMFYDESLDEYVFNKKFDVYWLKFNMEKLIKKDLNIQLQNKPIRYWIGFVKEEDILTNQNSPGWDYIKYDRNGFKALPEIVIYTLDDLKNNWFFVYKPNIKLQTLKNKTWRFYPVVIYETEYWPSEIRVLGLWTITDYIKDPETWQYISVQRVVYRKPYKIDTVKPIFFNIKSSNTAPKIGDIVDLQWQTTEYVDITKATIGKVDLLSSYSITKVYDSSTKVYTYTIKNVTITTDMFDEQGQLWFTIWWYDQANNYNERKYNLAWLKGGISTDVLKVWKITSAGDINVSDVLISNDPNVKNLQSISVLTNKKIISDKIIKVNIPKKEDGTIDIKKLFKNTKIIKITIDNYQNYIKTIWTNICTLNYIDNKYHLHGDCGFIRNRVLEFDSDLVIDWQLKYKWYTTLFVNGNVDIQANVEKYNINDKQDILWIINTKDIYIQPSVTILKAVIKTPGTIYVLK